MTIHELKLGDWVIYPSNEGKKMVGQVDAIRDKYLVSIRGQFWPFSDELLEPIPLTGEILKKNDNSCWMGVISVCPAGRNDELGLTDWKVYVGNPRTNLEVRIIHFVHELQHIIWALGVDDNLRL